MNGDTQYWADILEVGMDMRMRPGDMHPGTALSIGVIVGGFRLETTNVKNEIGEARFVEFTRSGTRSPETLFALDEVLRVLKDNGKPLCNGGFEWQLTGGSLQMMQDGDGDKCIRVWNENTGNACALDFTEENTPQFLRDTLGLLHSGMCVDCLSRK